MLAEFHEHLWIPLTYVDNCTIRIRSSISPASPCRRVSRHHVALSVVGADRLPDSGYLLAKVAQEKLIKASKIPYTIVRATQFFEFVVGIAQFATEGQTVRLPPALMQTVVSDDVAAALTDIAVGEPRNDTIELASP